MHSLICKAKVYKCPDLDVLEMQQDFLADRLLSNTDTYKRYQRLTNASSSDELRMIAINTFPSGSELFRHSQELEVTQILVETVVGASEFLRSELADPMLGVYRPPRALYIQSTFLKNTFCSLSQSSIPALELRETSSDLPTTDRVGPSRSSSLHMLVVT